MSTGINYLDEVWNPVSGCQGKGCKCHCWARDMVKRFPQIHGWDPDTEDGHVRGYSPLEFSKVQFHPDRLDKPLHWKKPRRIGVSFMGDLFDEQVSFEWVAEVLCIIKSCPHHQFFILTKQPKRMAEFFDNCGTWEGWITHNGHPNAAYGGDGIVVGFEFAIQRYRKENKKRLWPLPNVYLGVSITDQEDADRMIPELLRIPGKHWVSYEPMLGGVNFLFCPFCQRHCLGCDADLGMPDWIVCGCESGPKRRPTNPDWFRSARDQCKAAGVKLWIKQMEINGKVTGDVNLFPEDLRIREWEKP